MTKKSEFMTRPTRHPSIEQLYSEPENHCPNYQGINAEVRQRGGRKEGGRSGSWKGESRGARESGRDGGSKKRVGERSGWVGGMGREEERNESDMMLLHYVLLQRRRKMQNTFIHIQYDA